ncbi:hypothetical protein [Paraburkholderia aspalathi]|uniref:hypothetical protein n=1 Tax=Paraburkholderia aspalathi TaxID=1324617 RepID=UPI001BAE3020|nr:hypothetical protein [Paraburkholderia aspalathi]
MTDPLLAAPGLPTNRRNRPESDLRHFVPAMAGFKGMLLKKSRQLVGPTAGQKIDLSERPTGRSRASVKGKATHENIAM